MAINRTCVTLLLSLLLVAGLASGQEGDVEGSKDHPLISRYPGSVIREYSSKEFDEYTLPLGKMTGDNTLAKSQHLEGKLTRFKYESPAGRAALEVFRNYEGALKRAGFATLFTCSQYAQCGGGILDSVPNGYYWCPGCGPRHLSAELSRPEGDVYVSLHVEEGDGGRGPGVSLDIIEMKPMEAGLITVNAETLAGDISRTGHSAVYGIYFDTGKAAVKAESETVLKEIAKLLQLNPQLKLHIVGHTDSVGELAYNMDLSRRRAQAVVQVLTTKHGIAPARLRAEGIGPLAPVASNDAEEGRAKNRRVELVKQ